MYVERIYVCSSSSAMSAKLLCITVYTWIESAPSKWTLRLFLPSHMKSNKNWPGFFFVAANVGELTHEILIRQLLMSILSTWELYVLINFVHKCHLSGTNRWTWKCKCTVKVKEQWMMILHTSLFGSFTKYSNGRGHSHLWLVGLGPSM